MKKFEDMLAELPKERRVNIEAMAKVELLKLHLAELRKKRAIKQLDIAKALGLTKSAISQLENRKQIGIETLMKYVMATGGRLEVRAVYQDETEILI